MKSWSRTLACILAILSVLLPSPQLLAVYCQASGGPETEYATIQLGEEGLALFDGSMSPAEAQEAIAALAAGATRISFDTFRQKVESLGQQGIPVEPPVGPNGEPLPPPIRLPPRPNGQPNPWVPQPGSPYRPVKWVPQFPVPSPNGGQPGSSWDPEGHHDVDNGRRTGPTQGRSVLIRV